MPVLSVHAPCLLISQRVWGANPIPKLDRSVRAAEQLGAQTVVVHPPFRWQRRYAEGFQRPGRRTRGLQRCDGGGGEHVPVPRRPVLRCGQTSIERMRKRGGKPGPASRRSRRPTIRSTASMLTTRSTCHTPRPPAPMPWTWPRGWARSGPPAPVRRQRRVHRRAPGARPRHAADRRNLRDARRRRLFGSCDPGGHHVGSAERHRTRDAAGRVASIRQGTPAALNQQRTAMLDSTLFTDAMALTRTATASMTVS